MIIFSGKRFLKILTLGFADAITLFPFVILNGKEKKKNKILINHEKIHIYQQMELLVVFFYIQYVYEYLFYRIKGYKHYNAYRSISFEKEAYDNETDLQYLKNRTWYSWWKYL